MGTRMLAVLLSLSCFVQAMRRADDEADMRADMRNELEMPQKSIQKSGDTTDGPVLYSEDFDNLAVDDEWCREKTGSTCKVVSDGHSGNGVRVAYAPYDRGTDRLSTRGGEIDSPVLAATLSYDVFFENDFEWVKGGKLGAGLFGGQGTTGCKPIVGDGWSARLMWRADGRLEMYIYTARRQQRCGDRFTAMSPDGRISFQLQKGQWYNLKLSVRMNNPPNMSNGRAELFVNGKSRVVASGLQWRNVTNGTADIDKVKLSTFYGGSDESWSPSATTHIKYDNFIVREAFCAYGITKKTVCCAESCGTCGGRGCKDRNGGSSQCCTGSIERAGQNCTKAEHVGCNLPH